MADILIGGVVLGIFAALAYTLFFKKKKDGCHTSASCAGCAEATTCETSCSHCSPEELKNELRKALRE
ncbi:MAG TPA: hypothetical protein DCQ90_00440 [Erysipelotrichaceae bacterium]|nr:hypothetical protein [Erysipelotrichaceae bacterium]HAO60437.1 hypothetical protein [Erysipelotrichaceae bacterium]